MEKNFKIVVATDYSEVSLNAEKFAFQFAKNTNSMIELLHVFEIPFSSIPVDPNEYVITKEEFKKNELNKLIQHGKTLFSTLKINEKEVECNCSVRIGKVGALILDEADDLNTDLIILGTHGSTKFKEIFFGSHTWDVIKKANIPVLSVPDNVSFKGIKNMVFATDYREGEIPVLNYLCQFAKRFNASIAVIHISNDILSEKLENAILQKFKNEVRAKISYEKLEFHTLYFDSIIDGLNDFCADFKADLLIMSPERRFIWEKIFTPGASTTKKMTFHSQMPLLTIPDFFDPAYSKFWKIFSMDEDVANDDF